MKKIIVLPSEISQKIAAGEVIERPFSAVKELVENALDAAASEIKAELLSGGKGLIGVTDNGHGMGREDAQLSFDEQTSILKLIMTQADLFSQDEIDIWEKIINIQLAEKDFLEGIEKNTDPAQQIRNLLDMAEYLRRYQLEEATAWQYGMIQQMLSSPMFMNALPRFQAGTDFVPRDMMAFVHRGEEIVPSGGGGRRPAPKVEEVVPEKIKDIKLTIISYPETIDILDKEFVVFAEVENTGDLILEDVIIEIDDIQGWSAETVYLGNFDAKEKKITEIRFVDIHLNEDPVRIIVRGEHTKTKNSRTAFVSQEAKEAIEEWLKVRDDYLRSVTNENR